MVFFSRLSKQDSTLPTINSFISRRTLFKHLGVAATATALGSGLQALSPLNVHANEGPAVKTSGKNVVLVHGAFADASSWNDVTVLLQQAGYQVIAVELPLASLADDIDVTRQALASLSGPTVLVGHSYGGAVITGAGASASNVISLVYIAAFAPAEGETIADLNGRYPAAFGAKYIVPSYRKDFVWIDPPFFPEVFVEDIDVRQARALAASQKPIAGANFAEKAGPAAWQHLPSWYLVSQQDKAINPDLERWMAKRINATTREIQSSHASLISHPRAVAETILAATKESAKH